MGAIGDAQAGLADFDRRVVALEQDIGRCACLEPAEVTDWAAWRQDARAYLRIAGDRLAGLENTLRAATVAGVVAVGVAESFTDREAADVDRQTATWAAELGTWSQRVAARGGSLTAPGAPPSLGLPWLTIGLVLLGVVAVGAGVYYVKRPRRSPKRRNPAASFRKGEAVRSWLAPSKGIGRVLSVSRGSVLVGWNDGTEKDYHRADLESVHQLSLGQGFEQPGQLSLLR
jgi:hypothetical protein